MRENQDLNQVTTSVNGWSDHPTIPTIVATIVHDIIIN